MTVFKPGPSPSSQPEPDTFFPSPDNDLPVSGSVKTAAAPDPARELRQTLIAGLSKVLHPTRSGSGSFLFQILLIVGFLACLGYFLPDLDTLNRHVFALAVFFGSSGAAIGGWLFLRCHFHNRLEAYGRVHLTMLIASIMGLAGHLPENLALTITLPFLAGYGAISVAMILVMAFKTPANAS